MSIILIENIKGLFQAGENMPKFKSGNNMSDANLIENAYLLIADGLIKGYGTMHELPKLNATKIDATNRFVLPAFCDSHTHTVFASTREEEFVDRIKGLSYEEIALRGGGILNSANKLALRSEDDLFEEALKRINDLIPYGTGAIEIKSGYGLTFESEMKMLRVIKRLKTASPLTIKSTFLGAHAYPTEYKKNHKGYLKIIIEELLPAIHQEGLADYIDCFCERNYFSVSEMEEILEAGRNYNLIPKVHVNQFSAMGGVKAAVELNARSVDHLEELSSSDIESLKNTECIPTLLPGCSFFLSIPYSRARELINANLPVALATDYNPGSAPSGNMQLIASLACTKLKMTPTEALNALTINGAYAMGVETNLGTITTGKKANLLITKPLKTLAQIPYSFGENSIDQVILNGQLI